MTVFPFMETYFHRYGDMDAQYNLGVMYAKGRGVERNEAKAVELLTLAADKGDANAQLNLGIMYAKGRGVDKDEVKAFQLWERAAEQGHASAQSQVYIYDRKDRRGCDTRYAQYGGPGSDRLHA